MTAPVTQFNHLFNLAMARFDNREFAPALELWQWSLHYECDLHDTCAVRGNISACYFGLKRYDEAIALSQAVLDTVVFHFGPDHSIARNARRRIDDCQSAISDAKGISMHKEAHDKFVRKEFEEAYKLWVECVDYKIAPTRAWQAIRLMNMAVCCYSLGRYLMASAIITQANEFVDSGALNDGDEAELYAWNLQRIRVSFECQEACLLLDEAQTCLDKEDWDRAESAARDALAVVDQGSVGRECMLGAKCLDRLATACYKQGYSRCAEAAECWREARWLSERWAGKEQPELVVRCREMLERCRSN